MQVSSRQGEARSTAEEYRGVSRCTSDRPCPRAAGDRTVGHRVGDGCRKGSGLSDEPWVEAAMSSVPVIPASLSSTSWGLW